MGRSLTRSYHALAWCLALATVAACGSHASGALPPGPSGDGGTGQKEAGSAEDAMSGPANAYFASTLGGSDGCGLHVPAGTPFLSIGAEGNPVSNGGSFMGSSVSVICQVSATGTSSYNVNAQVGYGPQNGFNLSGTLSNVSGPQPNFTAQFTSASISYNESMCTVTLKPGGNAMNPSITSGRVWATLECPALTNMTTSGDVCAGQATFIFQNCAD